MVSVICRKKVHFTETTLADTGLVFLELKENQRDVGQELCVCKLWLIVLHTGNVIR